MDSDWLDPAEIVKMLDEASAGSPRRLSAWLRENPLRCTSPDYTSLVLVRDHKMSRIIDDYPKDGWADLDAQPGPDDPRMQFINLLWRIEKGGATRSRLPVPRARRIVEVHWLHGRYDFVIASDLRFVQTLPEILHERMVGSASIDSQPTDATIEDNFVRIFRNLDPTIMPRIPPIDWTATPAQLPQTIQDGVLGVLTQEVFYGSPSFQTTIVALGRRVSVVVRLDKEGSYEKTLRRAAVVVGRLDDYVAKAKRHTARAFLELKNNNWLAEDEQPLSSDEFEEQMQLSWLEFDGKGGVEFTFADSASGDRPGMFGGHWIVVTMRGNDRFTRVELEG